MKFLPLVWKNVWRRKFRTTFTLLSIFVAFLLFGILMTIRTGELGTAGERDAQRLHQAEQQERDDDGRKRQAGAQPFAAEIGP